MKSFTLAILVFFVIALSGCAMLGGPSNQTNQTQNITVVTVKTPSFSIAKPSTGQIIAIDGNMTSIDVVLDTQNLILKYSGGAAVKGQGHFLITLDNSEKITTANKVYTIDNVSIGSHTIEVELLNNDLSHYSPRIVRSVSFTLEQNAQTTYAPQTYTVYILQSGFNPANISLKAGDSITFVNNATMEKAAVSIIGNQEIFNTKVLERGQSITIPFNTEGDIQYHTTDLSTILGDINVQSNGTG